MGRPTHIFEYPLNASLHVISKLPLFGISGLTKIYMQVIYSMTRIQPSKNTANGIFPARRVCTYGAFHQYDHCATHTCLSPCQVCPKLVPTNQSNCFAQHLSFCNMWCFLLWCQVHPGEQIQKQLLGICIWKLCYFITTTLETFHSSLNKSIIHHWKWATRCTLIWSFSMINRYTPSRCAQEC